MTSCTFHFPAVAQLHTDTYR